MHLSLAGSAVLMLLLLFALGNFVGVQPGQITRDVDNGQLTDNRPNLRSRWQPMSLFKTLDKRGWCASSCTTNGDCGSPCYCTTGGHCHHYPGTP
uniref:Conotoxin n=1 Tax=Conus andremenezi TaxID=1077466 RepID=A0A291C259_9COND|nr:conotoxin [Conus andremenezi]